ncbi:MAG UNVERIFIED_CONTAM: hypothetical protein LVR18_47340 [Planctomycetaceae bacterium]
MPIGHSRSITRIVSGRGPVFETNLLERIDRRQLIEMPDLVVLLRNQTIYRLNLQQPRPLIVSPRSNLAPDQHPLTQTVLSTSELDTNGFESSAA